MTASQNPVASEHLPFFITAPGGTDVLFNIMVVFVLLSVVFFGIVFLTIHSLPERMAHKSKKVQFDIVAVLCLLALFTHEHVFWVAALLLAFIDIPDFSTPFKRIVTAVETIAEQHSGGTAPAEQSDSKLPKAVPADQPRQIQKGSVHA
jgi:hypothetical protein